MIRLGCIWFSFAGLMGFCGAGKWGFYLAEWMATLLWVYSFASSERHLLKNWRASAVQSRELLRLVEQIARKRNRACPHLYEGSEAYPTLSVVKSWGSSGAFLLSEGILQGTTQKELVEWLNRGFDELQDSRIHLRTTSAWWLGELWSRVAPQRFETLRPSHFLRALILAAIERELQRLADRFKPGADILMPSQLCEINLLKKGASTRGEQQLSFLTQN